MFPFLVWILFGGRPEVPELPAAAVADERPSAPAIAAAPDGAVLLVWESRGRGGGERDIRFSRREPGPDGAWLPVPVRLDTDPPGAARSLEPRVAAGAGQAVHAAWQDARDGADDIRVTRSTDGGRSWIAPDLRVDSDPPGAAVSSMPALAADGQGRVYLAWEDQRHGDRDIRFARSTDGGRTFGPDVRLDAGEAGRGVSYHPDILCRDDGTVLVFWRDERDGLADVRVCRSVDGGAAWEAETRLDPGPAGASASRDLGVAAGEGRIAAVWEEAGTGILARVSTDGGATWEAAEVVTQGAEGIAALGDPLLAAAGSRGSAAARATSSDGSVCLAWIRETADGPRLEARVIAPREGR